MITFRTQFDRVRKFSSSGEEFHPTYELQVDENGVTELKKIGKINTYEQIQSWKDSCDLKTILRRFANGDVNALSSKVPMFGDFSSVPSSLAEYHSQLLQAEEVFSKLPAEIRSEFNNSASQFFVSYGSPKFNTVFSKYISSKSQSSNTVVSNDVKEVREGE